MNTSGHRPVFSSVALTGLVLFVGLVGAEVAQSLVLGQGLSTGIVIYSLGINAALTLALLCLVGGLVIRAAPDFDEGDPSGQLFLLGVILIGLAAVTTVTQQSQFMNAPSMLVWLYGPTVVTWAGLYVVLSRCLAGRPELDSDHEEGLWERVRVSSTAEPADDSYLPVDAGPLGDIAYVAVATVVVQLLLSVVGWPSLGVVGTDLWKVVWLAFAVIAAPTGAFLFALGVVFRREFSVPTAIGAAGVLTVIVGLLGVSLLVVNPGENQVVLANAVGQLRWVVRFVAAVLLFRSVFAFRATVGPAGRDTSSRNALDSW